MDELKLDTNHGTKEPVTKLITAVFDLEILTLLYLIMKYKC